MAPDERTRTKMTIEEKSDPLTLFDEWLAEAEKLEPNDPNAMTVATATPEGRPSARMLLLKGHDARGFVFYTNMESRKGIEIKTNPFAALLFHWKSLRRQVRVEGALVQVSDQEADAYFDSRARGSRIGAWASKQSRAMEGRWDLEKAVASYTAKFHIGSIPRPSYWTGMRLVPDRIEFWMDKPFRLHDRLVYVRNAEGWVTERLFP